MSIEHEGIEAVEKLIRRNKYLRPHFQRDDKLPIFDGEVFVYKDSNVNKPNTSLIGCVKVQIKGLRKKKGKESVQKLKYQVKVHDLEVFLNDGGAIFFVSEIYEDYSSKVFFCELLPLVINRVLKDKKKQKSVYLEFLPFPLEETEIADTFLNFLENKRAQMSTTSKEKVYLQDWLDAGQDINEISITYSSFNKNYANPFQLMTSRPV